ncbi:MAG: sigma factor-like helix-turn-helix DNA-binding protein [Planctomycetota bacterium]
MIKPCDNETDPASELARKMELEALDRELENLPERLRAPLVEHYLLGHSAPEIAERMELSLSAVEGRLKRGRRKLRTLLARRGISLSVLAAGSLFFQKHLAASESAAWASNFVDSHLPSGDVPADAQPPLSPNPEVSSLVQGEMMMLGMSAKSSIAAAIMVTAGALAVWAADPFEHGQGKQQSGSSGTASTAVADATVQAVPPAQPAPVKFFPPNAGANTLGQFGGGEGGQAGFGGGLGAGSDSQEPEGPPVAWTKPEGEAPGWLSAGSRAVSGAEKHRMMLSEEIEFDYPSTSLQAVIEDIAGELNVQIEISTDELDLLGVDVDTPVTASGRGPMRELFRRILKPLELTYRVNESSIEITSKEDAEANPAIRFYDLSFILPNTANLDSLQNAIQQSIDPDSWYDNGGTSSITNVGSMMVVGAPEETHQKVEVFLMKIGQMNPKNLESPVGKRSMGGGSNGGGMF